MKMIIVPNEKYGPPLLYNGNHLLTTAHLSNDARVLLDVFVLHMKGDDNLIYVNDDAKTFYLSYFKHNLKKKFPEKSFQPSINELEKAHLISRKSDDTFVVNQGLFRRVAKILNPIETKEEESDIIHTNSDNERVEFLD